MDVECGLRNGNLVSCWEVVRPGNERRSIDRVICGEMAIKRKDNSSGFPCCVRIGMFL